MRNPMFAFSGTNLGCHVTLNPAGTYSFVGSVPCALSVERRDGKPVDAELAANIARHGKGLFRHIVKSRTWPSEEAARTEAARLGFELAN